MKREQDKKVGFDELGEPFFFFSFGKRYYQVEDD
jgi:hypothetical protein